MRTLGRMATAALALGAAAPLATAQANRDILTKVELTSAGGYVFPTLVVVLAALLLMASLVQRAGR